MARYALAFMAAAGLAAAWTVSPRDQGTVITPLPVSSLLPKWRGLCSTQCQALDMHYGLGVTAIEAEVELAAALDMLVAADVQASAALECLATAGIALDLGVELKVAVLLEVFAKLELSLEVALSILVELGIIEDVSAKLKISALLKALIDLKVEDRLILAILEARGLKSFTELITLAEVLDICAKLNLEVSVIIDLLAVLGLKVNLDVLIKAEVLLDLLVKLDIKASVCLDVLISLGVKIATAVSIEAGSEASVWCGCCPKNAQGECYNATAPYSPTSELGPVKYLTFELIEELSGTVCGLPQPKCTQPGGPIVPTPKQPSGPSSPSLPSPPCDEGKKIKHMRVRH